MRKALEKCIVIPRFYEDILTFTQLTGKIIKEMGSIIILKIGICRINEKSYDNVEFINVYL